MEKPHCAQSPIDVVPSVTSNQQLDLSLHWQRADGVPVWDDHGLVVTFPPNPQNYVRFGSVNYLLDSFHFHHKSEHLKQGKRFPAELHIVHKAIVGGKEKAVVFAIFITMPPRVARHADNGFFEALRHYDREGLSQATVPLNPIGWLPSGTKNAIRYEGSLTTGNFDEIVSWVILGDKQITMAQYNFIFDGTTPNARGLQALNRRFVVQYHWSPKV